MGFSFPDDKPKAQTVTITLDEYNELKLAMQFIEDNNHTIQFMMYQDLLNSPQSNVDGTEDDIIFIDSN